MRKLSVLLAALVLVAGISAQSSAATLTLQGNAMGLTISVLPPITTGGGSAVVFVSSGTGGFVEPAGVFGPVTVVIPKTLFTGVPSISGLDVVGFGNLTKVVGSGTAVGGVAGSAVVNVLQFAGLPIPLSVVGVPGATAMAALAAIIITVVGQGWTTGVAVVTGVTSGTTSGVNNTNTVSVTGTDTRTAGHQGNITLISGFQAITSVAGSLSGFASQSLTFVPEPGTLLILGSGIAGLGILGVRRMRK